MSIQMGDRVLVKLNPRTQIPKNPVQKFDGKVFTVEKVKLSYIAQSPRRQYRLYGCESEKGVPYWFIEEELIRIKE